MFAIREIFWNKNIYCSSLSVHDGFFQSGIYLTVCRGFKFQDDVVFILDKREIYVYFNYSDFCEEMEVKLLSFDVHNSCVITIGNIGNSD